MRLRSRQTYKTFCNPANKALAFHDYCNVFKDLPKLTICRLITFYQNVLIGNAKLFIYSFITTTPDDVLN